MVALQVIAIFAGLKWWCLRSHMIFLTTSPRLAGGSNAACWSGPSRRRRSGRFPSSTVTPQDHEVRLGYWFTRGLFGRMLEGQVVVLREAGSCQLRLPGCIM